MYEWYKGMDNPCLDKNVLSIGVRYRLSETNSYEAILFPQLPQKLFDGWILCPQFVQ